MEPFFIKKWVDLVVGNHSLRSRFIAQYDNLERTSIIDSDDYIFSISSFIVLSHAMIEDYIEEVVLSVCDRAIDDWNEQKKISLALFSMASFYNKKEIPKDDKYIDSNILIHDTVLDLKTKIYGLVHNNNGIKPNNLNRLLLPVGINIASGYTVQNIPVSTLNTSLRDLANYRGDYAHKNPLGIQTITPPSVLLPKIDDCIRLCHQIALEAEQVVK